MPTYEFACEACGHRLERFEPMSSAPPAQKCPACHAMKLIRLIGAGVITDVKLRRERLYPYVSSALPRQIDPATGRRTQKVVVESKAHEREIMAGALNGERYEKGEFDV